MTDDLIARLRQLSGNTGKMTWVGDLPMPATAVLHLAADELDRLRAELSEAKSVIIEANNSLYGSQTYFLSLNGGPADKYHLANGIENLKKQGRASEKDGAR